jgi:hypothetical protein
MVRYDHHPVTTDTRDFQAEVRLYDQVIPADSRRALGIIGEHSCHENEGGGGYREVRRCAMRSQNVAGQLLARMCMMSASLTT